MDILLSILSVPAVVIGGVIGMGLVALLFVGTGLIPGDPPEW